MKYFLLFFAVIMAISARSAQAQTDLIERGKTLFRAADCAACHLSDDGQTLSGGKAFSLPFGTVYAVNITPDRQTGIGAYTDEQWLRMMRTGVDRNGRHLYPVMPYTSYTFLNDADTLAIKTYLFTLKPVQAKTPENRLPFPFNQRWVMTFWNWFNNPNRRLAPVPDRTAEWNRGAYLVEALGHCDQCHTPRNFMFGLSRRAYAGTVQVGWRAYNLTSDTEHGLGGWSDDELFEYLSTGYAPHHGPASGPMAEAIENSLRYLPAEDIRAMIVYLRSIPARSDGPTRGKRPLDTPRENETVGQHIFQQACMGCHLEDGAGRQSAWGALEGAHNLSDPATTNITSVLRTGTSIETEHGKMAMPSFANAYTPQELAAVSEYLLSHFGGVKAQIKPRMFKN